MPTFIYDSCLGGAMDSNISTASSRWRKASLRLGIGVPAHRGEGDRPYRIRGPSNVSRMRQDTNACHSVLHQELRGSQLGRAYGETASPAEEDDAVGGGEGNPGH